MKKSLWFRMYEWIERHNRAYMICEYVLCITGVGSINLSPNSEFIVITEVKKNESKMQSNST